MKNTNVRLYFLNDSGKSASSDVVEFEVVDDGIAVSGDVGATDFVGSNVVLVADNDGPDDVCAITEGIYVRRDTRMCIAIMLMIQREMFLQRAGLC
jgi:hypothetical protein